MDTVDGSAGQHRVGCPWADADALPAPSLAREQWSKLLRASMSSRPSLLRKENRLWISGLPVGLAWSPDALEASGELTESFLPSFSLRRRSQGADLGESSIPIIPSVHESRVAAGPSERPWATPLLRRALTFSLLLHSKVIGPVFEKLEASFPNIDFYKVDVDVQEVS